MAARIEMWVCMECPICVGLGITAIAYHNSMSANAPWSGGHWSAGSGLSAGKEYKPIRIIWKRTDQSDMPMLSTLLPLEFRLRGGLHNARS